MGQEDILRPVRAILRQLPIAAEVTEITEQPVVVRRYAEPNGTTILVVNSSPWQPSGHHARCSAERDNGDAKRQRG